MLEVLIKRELLRRLAMYDKPFISYLILRDSEMNTSVCKVDVSKSLLEWRKTCKNGGFSTTWLSLTHWAKKCFHITMNCVIFRRKIFYFLIHSEQNKIYAVFLFRLLGASCLLSLTRQTLLILICHMIFICQEWKQGKRKAECDKLVGASFFMTVDCPPQSLPLIGVYVATCCIKCFFRKGYWSNCQVFCYRKHLQIDQKLLRIIFNACNIKVLLVEDVYFYWVTDVALVQVKNIWQFLTNPSLQSVLQ